MKDNKFGHDYIRSEDQAIEILDDPLEPQFLREEAVRYLSLRPTERAINKLVWALQDDDFGVRWEASICLASLGSRALPELLKALVDPKRVGDSRLRAGAYRMLHHSKSQEFPVSIQKLLLALKGPGADIVTLEEAGKLLLQLEKIQRDQKYMG